MNNKSKGISMALIAAILWGISGNFAEYIFTHSDITDLSYTTFRMLFSGIILLIYGIFLNSFSEFKKLIFDRVSESYKQYMISSYNSQFSFANFSSGKKKL